MEPAKGRTSEYASDHVTKNVGSDRRDEETRSYKLIVRREHTSKQRIEIVVVGMGISPA